MKYKNRGISMPDEDWEKLDALAKEIGGSRSAAIRHGMKCAQQMKQQKDSTSKPDADDRWKIAFMISTAVAIIVLVLWIGSHFIK